MLVNECAFKIVFEEQGGTTAVAAAIACCAQLIDALAQSWISQDTVLSNFDLSLGDAGALDFAHHNFVSNDGWDVNFWLGDLLDFMYIFSLLPYMFYILFTLFS